MKQINIFFFTVLSLFTLTVTAQKFSQCEGFYPNPLEVTISPVSPIFGETLIVRAITTANIAIEAGAYIYLQVNDTMSTFYHTDTQEICNLKNQVAIVTCPISGYFDYTYDYKFYPMSLKPSTYNIKASFKNLDNSTLSCVTATVVFQDFL